MNIHDYLGFLPKRQPDTHKKKCGKIGIIAGSDSMLGAAVLTALGALKSGAGLIYLMTVKEAVPFINIVHPEIIVIPLTSKDGYLSDISFKEINNNMNKYGFDVMAVGPGLGREPFITDLVQNLLFSKDINIPFVLDADALHSISFSGLKKLDSDRLVLTPHPGEFKHLFKLDAGHTDKERLNSVEKIVNQLNQVLVLKGKNTIVANKEKKYINKSGNPGMATAGTGDVLTGIIASFIGQGISLFEAAVLGVYAHGLAGDKVYAFAGNGLTATDISNKLPEVLVELGSSKSREKC
ncbi:NAD(P)H-hydrate dehydratase [Candidatus Margulisiibacteriota bacterium]